jgi:hypothetical protein
VKFVRSKPGWALLLLLASLALGGAGCSTVEPENTSSRPWNAPQGWENQALPSNFNQGR